MNEKVTLHFKGFRYIMKINTRFLVNSFIILNTFGIFARSEYASALVNLEQILTTQGKISKTLENYIQLEEKRLEKISRLSEKYNELFKAASKDVDNFLSNPINSYLLVKRLTTDLKYLKHYIAESTSKEPVNNLTQSERFPNDYDLEEAANALVRLQETYLLNTTDLVEGEVAGMKGASKLTASDCFELGVGAFNDSFYNLAVDWFQKAMDKMKSDEFQIVDEIKLLEYFSYSAYFIYDVKTAINLTKQLIKINPQHHYYQNLEVYEEELLEQSEKDLESKETTEKTSSKGKVDPNKLIKERYKKLCRGEKLNTPFQESKLKCRYTTRGSKYLILQPAKEEALSLDPWVVVYHDVIRDNDMDILKNISEPLLERAGIIKSSEDSEEYSKNRVSKSGWLDDDHHPRMQHINTMIGEITGLEMETTEDLQMNKYGTGGHYLTHYDFRSPEEVDPFVEYGTGNRIATFLIYLNDVEAGGSTIFPDIGVQIKPTKGSAGFWYNLLRNGDGDYRTKHAACPVLTGEKWVANKWFHERGHEFKRPCSLNSFE